MSDEIKLTIQEARRVSSEAALNAVNTAIAITLKHFADILPTTIAIRGGTEEFQSGVKEAIKAIQKLLKEAADECERTSK